MQAAVALVDPFESPLLMGLTALILLARSEDLRRGVTLRRQRFLLTLGFALPLTGYLIAEAWRAEVPRREIAKMLRNAAVDVVVERVDGARARSTAVAAVAPLGAVKERGLLAVTASPATPNSVAFSGISVM